AFRSHTREEIAVVKARGYDATRDRVYPLEPELVYTYPVLNLLAGVSAINDYGPIWAKRYAYMSGFYNNGIQLPQRVPDVRLLSITSARFVLTRSPDMRTRLLSKRTPHGAQH